MNTEEQILQKLDRLTSEVAELREALNQQKQSSSSPQETSPALLEEDQKELVKQLGYSSASLVKWLKFSDQLMELKEDMVPLGKPVVTDLIQMLDHAAHGFDPEALKELIKVVFLNLSNLSQAITMVGGLVELKNDSTQITKEAFEDAIILLESLKQRGFFDSMMQLAGVMENIGQRMLEMETSPPRPIKGVWGLYSVLKQKDFQEGLGVLVDLVSVFSALKKQKMP